MKKLWTVTLETTAVVLAETRAEAEEEARDSLRDLSAYDYDVHASDFTSYSGEWDGSALPYGTEDDKTIDEWIAEGAGEAFLKKKAEWEARMAGRPLPTGRPAANE